ncbi:MAG: ASCH domain-containing protein [Parvimonas sp.]|uniref:ASCH domain-containing protein n=1 Tax=Parvimonas sp. TaxID=1944660 RepID=UPI001CAC0B5D|nr:ASCH domain-containing protein [Parvimonas sp.]MBF1295494.1 ASCH domain-containing protein [Parvimonas sp.]
MSDKIKKYWKKFCKEKNIPIDTKYEAWSFGNTKEMADELADLVNKGIKTATTGAYDLFEEDEEIPKVGEYNIILDGSGNPICITITRDVYILKYNLISSNHAFLEGEGDRSYEYWKKVHDEYFTEEFKNSGKEFYEQAPMVCEVFEKVY